MKNPFHLAIRVRDLEEAGHFYGDRLALPQGRRSERWIDYDLFGHQLVVHLDPGLGREGRVPHASNPVDGHGVPVPHFGVVLTMAQWQPFVERVRAAIEAFVIEPCIRFEGEPGEQATMFFLDPSGNALEFKAFRNIETQLFARQASQ